MHEVAHVDIRIDRGSGTPAYRQIYQQIAAGSIPAGALVPKIRDLAASLGVARDTAEAAYRQLSLEGYAHGKRGSATWSKTSISRSSAHSCRSRTPPPHPSACPPAAKARSGTA